MRAMSADASEAVDIVFTVFERTYRRALAGDRLAAAVADNRHPFARRVVLINNVDDPDDARARAQELIDASAVDEFHFVAEQLDRTLRTVGLTRAELEPLLHYSDGPLVAATLPGSPWFLYWDPEARLTSPCDWVSPTLEMMRADARIMVANPSREAAGPEGDSLAVRREAIDVRDGFALGHGFSDQVFLAARASMAAPIYRQRCIASITYPAAHKTRVFEARVGAHMRHHGRLRATSLSTSYVTDISAGGSSYPPSGAVESLRYVRNALAIRTFRTLPWRPACLRQTWL